MATSKINWNWKMIFPWPPRWPCWSCERLMKSVRNPGLQQDQGLHVNERPQEKSLTLMSSSCFCLAALVAAASCFLLPAACPMPHAACLLLPAACCLVIYNVSNQGEPNWAELWSERYPKELSGTEVTFPCTIYTNLQGTTTITHSQDAQGTRD